MTALNSQLPFGISYVSFPPDILLFNQSVLTLREILFVLFSFGKKLNTLIQSINQSIKQSVSKSTLKHIQYKLTQTLHNHTSLITDICLDKAYIIRRELRVPHTLVTTQLALQSVCISESQGI
jgi:hypothetical protein